MASHDSSELDCDFHRHTLCVYGDDDRSAGVMAERQATVSLRDGQLSLACAESSLLLARCCFLQTPLGVIPVVSCHGSARQWTTFFMTIPTRRATKKKEEKTCFAQCTPVSCRPGTLRVVRMALLTEQAVYGRCDPFFPG